MKYIWLEELTCDKLEQDIGTPVKSITKGQLIIGYDQTVLDEQGNPNPIVQKGIEIELENETPEALAKLDIILQGLKREGGRDIATVVADNISLEYPNPQKEAYKLSQLYGMTQAQLETYIDNNVTNLAEAKTFLKKLSAVVLWLVKQTKLE